MNVKRKGEKKIQAERLKKEAAGLVAWLLVAEWSLEKIASRLQVSWMTVQRWKDAQSVPRLRELKKIRRIVTSLQEKQ